MKPSLTSAPLQRSESGPHRIEPGTFTLICGCMFSGKTTDMLRMVGACAPHAGRAFKPAVDVRYGADVIVTHGGQAMPAVAVARPGEIPGHLHDGFELIAIDEAHFFDASLTGVVRRLADQGRHIIVTALDRDSWGEPFGVVESLRSLADDTVVRHAICARCGRQADRTQRLTPIRPNRTPRAPGREPGYGPRHVSAADLVGGPEAYEPRCRHCWSPPPNSE